MPKKKQIPEFKNEDEERAQKNEEKKGRPAGGLHTANCSGGWTLCGGLQSWIHTRRTAVAGIARCA